VAASDTGTIVIDAAPSVGVAPIPPVSPNGAAPATQEGAAAPGVEGEGCPYAGRCPHTMPVCWREMPPLVDYGPRLGETHPHWAACHWVEQNLGATSHA